MSIYQSAVLGHRYCPYDPLNDYTNHPFIIKRGADIRHTLHGSPQTTTIYGNSAPILGAAPIIVVALSFVVVIVKL